MKSIDESIEVTEILSGPSIVLENNITYKKSIDGEIYFKIESHPSISREMIFNTRDIISVFEKGDQVWGKENHIGVSMQNNQTEIQFAPHISYGNEMNQYNSILFYVTKNKEDFRYINQKDIREIYLKGELLWKK